MDLLFGRAAAHILKENGYDQIPVGSVEYHRENIELLARCCKQHIAKERLFGFIQTAWFSVEEKYKYRLFDGATVLGDAIKVFEEN